MIKNPVPWPGGARCAAAISRPDLALKGKMHLTRSSVAMAATSSKAAMA